MRSSTKKKKKEKKNKRGFSLIELLAVIVIVSIISVLSVVGVSRYVYRARQEKVNQNKKNIALAAELYLQTHREEMPVLVGDASIVNVGVLRDNNYLKEDVTNSQGETCMVKSFVRVYKLDDDEYSYTTYLYCGDDEVPDEPDIPTPKVISFEFTGGKQTNGKFNDVKNAKFSFKIKGAENDDTVGVYSYGYTIFVRASEDQQYTEVFNSGSLKGGLEPIVEVNSQSLSKYISLTSYSNVRVDITAINEQGGKLDYTKTTGDFEDKEAPICGEKEGEAKDDDDWINKVTYGSNGSVPSGQLRAYPGRITVNCDDGNGSGCKRDRFTRSWPNNSRSVSGIDYKLGARWSYVLLEDNAGKTNSTKCYVRANVDLQSPDVTINVYRAKDKALVASLNVKDDTKPNATMPEGTLASNKYKDVTGTSDEKWLNLENYGTDGIYIDVDIKDNLYLYSYEWKVNNPYVAGGTSDSIVASTASTSNVSGEGTKIAATGTFKSTGMTDNPTNDEELKTAEHGSLKDTLKGLKITREGKRYASLKVCDKAGNCTTIHIYANIDVTPPLVPTTSYEKITSRENYTPGNVSNYLDHYHWSKEFVRAYIEGQREDKETRSSEKVTLSGWDHFTYYYQKQNGKSNGNLTWAQAISNNIQSVLSGTNRYGFDIRDQGTHIVEFKSCDRAGNCSAKSVDDYVKVDTIKPTCDIVTKYEENGTDITSEAKATGSTNGSGWLKIGQSVRLSHSCEDEDNKYSSGCNGEDFHNQQTYLFNSDINTSKAGANGYNTTYGSGDNTAGGHVVDYAGNISDECPKMTVKVDHVAPTCQTNITWPEGNPLHPTTAGKLETGWLGLVNGTGPGKKTAKVSLLCTDPTSTSGLMTGVHSTCDNDGKYDKNKYNQQYHIYNTEMWITNAGAVGEGKGGQVIDIAGNITPCPADRTVKIDYTAPVCTTKLDYGIGTSAANYSKVNASPKSATGWLGWYGNTDTTKEMARVTQVCADSNGNQKSGCYGDMLYYVYDYEINTASAGAQGVGNNGNVEDTAGNKTNCSTDGNWHTVKIDYTRPICAVTVSSSGNASNTGNSNEIVRNWAYTNYDGRWLGVGAKVTIKSTCTTAENGTGTSSGCATDVSKDYTAEIKTTKATTGGDGIDYYVFDKADNRAASACTPKQVQIDLTGPTCTLESRYGQSVSNTSPIYNASTTNYQGWLDGSYKVRVTSQCTGDKLRNGQAGVGCYETAIHYNDYSAAAGTVFNAYRGANSDGSSYTIYDAVGNSTTCGTKQAKIDNQAPTCTVTSKTNTGANYGGGWTNTSYIRVERTCKDGSGSGCNEASQKAQYKDYSGTSGGVWTTTTGGAVAVGNGGTIKDNVGNTTTCKAEKTIKIDKEKPTCTITTENVGSWTNKNAVIQGKCNDGDGSGCKTSNSDLKVTFSTDTNKSYSYSKGLEDKAGNTNTCSGGPYDIKVQKTGPSCRYEKKSSTLNSPDGITITVYCSNATGSSNSALLAVCYNVLNMPGSATSSYAFTGRTSDVIWTATDVAGNSVTCKAPVSSKSQNSRAYCSTCKDCSSAGCKTEGYCDYVIYAKGKFSGSAECYAAGGVVSNDGRCMGSEKCCKEYKRSCSTCGGCSSGMGGYGDWYDGSHSAGWDGNYHYKKRTVYY